MAWRFGRFTASAPVLTGLIIAVIAIVVAWATSFLEPPVVEPTPSPRDTTRMTAVQPPPGRMPRKSCSA